MRLDHTLPCPFFRWQSFVASVFVVSMVLLQRSYSDTMFRFIGGVPSLLHTPCFPCETGFLLPWRLPFSLSSSKNLPVSPSNWFIQAVFLWNLQIEGLLLSNLGSLTSRLLLNFFLCLLSSFVVYFLLSSSLSFFLFLFWDRVYSGCPRTQ